MKMITRTRKTSVSGVMLISAKIDSPPSSSPPASESGSFPIAIALAFGLRFRFGGLVVGRVRRRRRALATCRQRVAWLLHQELEEFVGQKLHLRRDARGTLVEEVEQDDGLDGDENTGRSHHECLRDRSRHHRELDLFITLEATH